MVLNPFVKDFISSENGEVLQNVIITLKTMCTSLTFSVCRYLLSTNKVVTLISERHDIKNLELLLNMTERSSFLT